MAKEFFELFPKINYDIDGSKNTKVIVDILRRIRVRAEEISDRVLFYPYAMRNGETIEQISHDIYGSSKYHWILLLLNQIQDPFYDLVLDDREFSSFLHSKYGAEENLYSAEITIFKPGSQVAGVQGNVYSTGTTTTYELDDSTTSFNTKINIGDSISLVTPYYWYTANAADARAVQNISYTASQKVISKDISNRKFETDLDSSSFSSFTVAVDDENVVLDTVKVLTNVHHFERDITDSSGNILKKKATTNLKDYTNPDSGVTTIISNFDYEDEINEGKRNILILRPELLGSFIEEFEGLMSDIES